MSAFTIHYACAGFISKFLISLWLPHEFPFFFATVFLTFFYFCCCFFAGFAFAGVAGVFLQFSWLLEIFPLRFFCLCFFTLSSAFAAVGSTLLELPLWLGRRNCFGWFFRRILWGSFPALAPLCMRPFVVKSIQYWFYCVVISRNNQVNLIWIGIGINQNNHGDTDFSASATAIFSFWGSSTINAAGNSLSVRTPSKSFARQLLFDLDNFVFGSTSQCSITSFASVSTMCLIDFLT